MHISSIETSFLDYPNETTMLVFMSGCSLRCPNCHNPALQSPNVGEDITVDGLVHELIKRPMCRSITFSGGDPLFQEAVLIKYCKELCKHTKIGVYTGKSLKEVPEELLKYISFLKTEPYVEASGGIQKHTTNQKCWDIVDGKAVENKEYFKVK